MKKRSAKSPRSPTRIEPLGKRVAWTGDVLKFNVTSTATSVTRVTVGIRLTHEVGP